MSQSSAAGRDTQHLRPSSSQNCLCPWAHPEAGSSSAGRRWGSKGSKVGVCEQRGLAPQISSCAKDNKEGVGVAVLCGSSGLAGASETPDDFPPISCGESQGQRWKRSRIYSSIYSFNKRTEHLLF